MSTLRAQCFAVVCLLLFSCSPSGTPIEFAQDGGKETRVDGLDVSQDGGVDFARSPDGVGPDVAETADSDGGGELELVLDMAVEGVFGWPCETNNDCQSGFCLETADGMVCTQSCFDECPDGFQCLQADGFGPDLVYLCIPQHMHLCRPCLDHSVCRSSLANQGDKCVDRGAAGYFCGSECAEDESCPSGYLCENVPLVDGDVALQCVRADGAECDCSWLATIESAKTVCHQETDFGTCWGDRQCTEGGLSDCDAQEPLAESCDGLDNDCDGEVDEELGETSCGLGPCEHVVDNCMDGEAQECDPLEGAGNEVCDGADNDCDGENDEELGETVCGLGNCLKTVANCVDGKNNNCNPFEGAAAEECDGEDNDCDGLTDEEQGQLTCGLGNCVHTLPACDDGEPQVCDPLADAGVEVCDGFDNDCDGLVDEALGQSTCGLGICDHTVNNCVDGEEQFCDPLAGAKIEMCDGVDNDCDGETDEELGETNCGNGACDHTVANCSGGIIQVCNPFDGAGPEICDGLDNDCDGLVDEELGSLTCGVGTCFHTVPGCLAGEAQACDPLAGAADEVCDGQDNDCDGEIDEDVGVLACGLGICFHTVPLCDGGEIQVCDPMEGAALEVCDGQDNDCNGETDEELGELACGLGECFHTLAACANGEVQVCNPLEGAVLESCDGLDNNCNGGADEELGETTCGVGPCLHTVSNCIDGEEQECDAFEGAIDELCNGADDNCNGSIDEGFDDTDIDGEADCVDDDDDGDLDPDVTDCAPLDSEVHHGAQEICGNGTDDDCDGVSDNDCPVASCLTRLQADPNSPSGVYTIDPDGNGPIASFKTWCDMETDGGGWTYGAIVKTTTSSANRSRVAGLTAFGGANANKLTNEYSVNLTGVSFNQVRIDNFTKGSAVVRSTAAPATWNGTTYSSGGGLPAKRMSMASSREFRLGYYINYCSLQSTNIPMCFTSSGNPVNWVCDTDGGVVEGWVDPTGGELCGLHYCKKVWRDSACTSYLSSTAVYGFAVK